jgi:RND family efflux transporter MFP subunit
VIFTGRIEAVATVDVRAHVPGTLAKIHFKEGSEVNQGDVLFEIDPTPYRWAVTKSDADVALAEARLRRAEADFQRAQQLFTRRAISREEHDKAASDRAEADASVRVARASAAQTKIMLEQTRVVAPISGVVGRAQIDVGNMLRGGESGPVLVTLVSTDPVYVSFDMDEKSFLRLRKVQRQAKGKNARISIAVGVGDEEGFPHKGTIDFLDNRVNSNGGTLHVRGTLPNRDQVLLPGLSVRVRVHFPEAGTGR